MNRACHAWLIFSACLLSTALAVGWLSRAAWRADAERELALEESQIRNALWRMDSLAAPLLAVELNRPASRPDVDRSPRLAARLVHGSLRQIQNGEWRLQRTGEPEQGVAPGELALTSADWDRFLPHADTAPSTGEELASVRQLSDLIEWPAAAEPPLVSLSGRGRFDAEAPSRNQLAQQVLQLANSTLPPSPEPHPAWKPMEPLWVANELVLARRLPAGKSQSAIELCWLNWPEWKRILTEQLRETTIPLELVPCPPREDCTAGSEWQMVTLPLRLERVGNRPTAAWPMPLMTVWILLGLVAIAFAALLAQTLSLSERRAAFVSAVTHELRTPLTTFRLYSELLSQGHATSPEQRQTYYETLSTEANRLTHLVENVLAYARLERGRPTSRNERLTVAELWERCEPRLTQRVAASPLTLSSRVADDVRNAILITNTVAVEQILFNVVDNACKYARDAQDPRLEIVLTRAGDQVVVQIRDWGPGLSRTAQARLFQAFRKSSTQAAESAPGIGLGLALSARLARDLGGRLASRSEAGSGLTMELRLPLAGQNRCDVGRVSETG